MDRQETFRRLVTAARDDAPPLVDVSQSVVRDIGLGRKSRNLLPWIFAAVTSASAAAIIAIAARVFIARQNAGAGLIDSLFSVMQ
ncbi:MAG: hypothetical protein QGH94_12110 [Phycisphaerae bacterium]|jgi:hypothetical protein|nr:hypothetical protein [Phycisphaerae bacterium]MDP7288726.1 hypothetical protein [Phycisphaerae bacterium]